MKSVHPFGRFALVLAICLASVPSTRAQEAGADETVLYQTWFGANSQGMQDKALEAAKAYLEKFPKGQYAAYLKNWMMGPKLQAFNTALQAKNIDEVVKVGRDILTMDPENLGIHYAIAFNIRRLELAASPANFGHAKEAVEFSQSSIKLIEGGKVIEGGKFNKDASLAILWQIQALVAADAKKTDEAVALYTKSSASDPGNAGIVAYNLLALASLHKAPYDAAVGVYRAFSDADRSAATLSPEVKAALDAVYAKADPLIDDWARFVALTRARNLAAETREQVLASLKTVYGTRYAGDVTGLEPLLTKLQAEYAPKS